MRNGGSSAPASAAGGGSLAITERQKPAPSCVASLFQMLAKKKLFSSSSKKNKLLPPVRAQKYLPGQPPGGGEKTAAANGRPLMLDSVNYPRGKSEGHGISHLPPTSQDNSCSEMCTPGVVARLMGLSSMPAVSHQRPTELMDSFEIGDNRNDFSQGLPGTYGSTGNSHQKQQKPGQLIDERHGNSSQFNTCTQALWSQRHPHKVTSPLKSPRSISSRNKARLIEAAAKVLEPGLQSRNHHFARRHARLEYSSNSDAVASATAGTKNFSDQFSRDMCDADVPRLGAPNVGVSSLHNSSSNQWSEENAKRNSSIMRPIQNVPCQAQPEGNSKGIPVSSSEKARLKDSAQRTTDNQGVQKIQQRNNSRETIACSPLRQNNLKQNVLPVVCRAEDQGHMVQRQKNRGDQYVTNTAKDFVSLHKSKNSNTSLRSKGKVMDRLAMAHGSVENKNLSTKGHQTGGSHSDRSNKPKPKTATPRAMEKDMIIAKGAGMVTEKPKSTSSNSVKNGLRRQVESRNVSRCDDSGIVSFTFSSPTKRGPTLPGDNSIIRTGSVLGSPTDTGPMRHSCRDSQNVFSQRGLVLREVVQEASSLGTAESVSELKNRGINIPGGRVASPLFEKMAIIPIMEESPRDELQWECNIVDGLINALRDLPRPVELHKTCNTHEANEEVSNPSPSISRSNNHRIPLSFLPSTYANDDCYSGSPQYTAEAELKDTHPSKACTPPFRMQGSTTERNSRRAAEANFGQHGANPFEPAAQDNKMVHPARVTSPVELLLTIFCRPGQQRAKAPVKTVLLEIFESALATFTTTSAKNTSAIKATEAKDPLGDLAFDLVMECMESMCTRLCDSGYRSFSKLALGCTEERLAAEVKREIAACGGVAGRALDDLAVRDVERAVEAGMSSSREASRIGAQIERDLLQELVGEIWLDVSRRL